MAQGPQATRLACGGEGSRAGRRLRRWEALAPPAVQGVEVVGLEILPELARVCRDRGVVNVVVGDMAAMSFRNRCFGAILCLGGTLGICTAPEDVLAAAQEMARAARRDGLLLADIYDPTAEVEISGGAGGRTPKSAASRPGVRNNTRGGD
ncbi:hypothetical protein B6U99_01915 [Candidatus Geothermarchaeota archaeon ex4572_27]|nr:MAG: hypothetical protein B6U99_01915 [Candidatus Geothermarchaeota archaeon ex4572_27]